MTQFMRHKVRDKSVYKFENCAR